MASLGSLTVDLSANIVRFERALNRAENVMRKRSNKLARIAGRTAGLIAGSFATIGFGALTKRIIDAGDHMAKFGERIGISVEALSNLTFAAERSGVSSRTLEMALQRQTRRISEAAAGTGEAVKALKELGLSAEALNRLSPDQQFLALSEALSQVNSQQDRVRLGMKVWDSEGVQMLQIANQGAEAVQALMMRNRELGNTLTTETAGAFESVNDSLTDLGARAEGAARSLVSSLEPAISGVTTALGDGAEAVARYFADFGKNVRTSRDVEFLQRELADAQGTAERLGKELAGIDPGWKTKLLPGVALVELRAAEKQVSKIQMRLAAIRKERAGAAAAAPAAATAFNTDLGLPSDQHVRDFEKVQSKLKKERERAAADAAKDAERAAEMQKRAAERRQRETDAAPDLDQHLQEYNRRQREVAALNDRLFPERARVQQYTEDLKILSETYGENSEQVRALAGEFIKAGQTQDELKTKSNELQEVWSDLGGTFSSAFEDAIVNGGKMSDILKGLEQDIIRILTRKLVTEPLAGAVSSFGSSLFPGGGEGGAAGGGGGIGALIQKGLGFFGFGGGKAGGGPVFKGRGYMVGERGPELFVPSQSGTIVPGGGAGNTIIVKVDGSSVGGDRRSQQNLAVRTGRAVDRAMRRNT